MAIKHTCRILMLMLLVTICFFLVNPAQARRITPSSTKYTIGETLVISSTQEAIDTTGNVGKYTSIAIDSNGYDHISYYDTTNGDLKYATNTSGTWTISTIESSGNVGYYSSLKIDADNAIHIAYYSATNSSLKYATNSSGSWIITTIDDTELTGTECHLAVDQNGFISIVYSSQSGSSDYLSLKFATNVSGTWVKSTLAPADYTWVSSNIVIDTSGFAHISYYREDDDAGTAELIYLTNSSGSWSTTSAGTCSTVFGNYSSIQLDSSNNPVISYLDGSYSAPGLVQKSGSTWDCTSFDTTNMDGAYTSFVLDASGTAAVAYYDLTDDTLKFMTNSDMSVKTAWNGIVLDDTGDVGQYNAMALDSTGLYHVSYYDATNGDLLLQKFYIDNGVNWYADTDGDGYGDAANSAHTSSAPTGYVSDNTDCDDTSSSVNPSLSEICTDLIDNNCDGNINESCHGTASADDDGDGYSDDSGDCNDANASISPAATEICDGRDNDCDGLIDDSDASLSGGGLWYLDSDNDGYGDEDTAFTSCAVPAYSSATAGDCDDGDATTNPAVTEICDDLLDNNCDGGIDDLSECTRTNSSTATPDETETTEEIPSVTSSANSIDASLGACSLSNINTRTSAEVPFLLYIISITFLALFSLRMKTFFRVKISAAYFVMFLGLVFVLFTHPVQAEEEAKKADSKFDKMVNGYFSNSFRFRTTGDVSDYDAESLLSVDIGNPSYQKITGAFEVGGIFDLNGKQTGGLSSIYDSFDSSAVGRFYYGYISVQKTRPFELVRIGRQHNLDFESFYFDGVSFDAMPCYGLKLSGFAGVPVHLFENQFGFDSGDWLGGAGLTWTPIRKLRFRFDYAHLKDDAAGFRITQADQSDDLMGASMWFNILKSWDAYLRFTSFADQLRDATFSSTITLSKQAMQISFRAYRLLQGYDVRVLDLDAYAIAGTYQPYTEAGITITKDFGKHVMVDSGFSMRKLDSVSTTSAFNHGFEHGFLSLTTTDILHKGLKLSATGDYYHGNDTVFRNNYFGGSFFATQELMKKRLILTAGSAYYLYHFNLSTGNELYNVQSYYGKVEAKLTKDLDAKATYEFENSDSEKYHSAKLNLIWNF